MNAKKHVLMWVCGTMIALGAAWSARAAVDTYTLVLLDRDFQANQSLSGWKDLFQASPPNPTYFNVTSESGNYFFRATNVANQGVTAPLFQPITVNPLLSNIVIQGSVRNHDVAAQTMLLALTSRTYPEGNAGDAFAAGADSGIRMFGYEYDNTANGVSWRTNGVMVNYSTSTAFMPLLWDVWHDWKLVFDRPAGTLAMYITNSTVPLLTQTGVNIDGVVLNSLFLRGAGGGTSADYDNLLVSATYFYTPEPSVLGLLVMGAAGVWWRRRRQPWKA